MNKIFESFKEVNDIKKIQFLMLFGKLSSPANKKQKDLNKFVMNKFYEAILIEDGKDSEFAGSLDPERPIINYRRERSKEILEKHNIEHCYNNWNTNFKFTSNKVEFHKNLNHLDCIPKTVFSVNEVEKLKFPVIAKPKDGLGGVGIEKFNTIEELKKSKLKHDLWSECVDFKREFRVIMLKEEVVVVYERIPSGDGEMVVGKKKPEDKIEFTYIDQDLSKLDFLDEVKKVSNKIKEAGMNTDLYSLDIFIDENKKVWVIEVNSGTGLGSNSLVKLYEKIYEDFYNKPVPTLIKKELEKVSTKYNNIVKSDYPKEYKLSYKPI